MIAARRIPMPVRARYNRHVRARKPVHEAANPFGRKLTGFAFNQADIDRFALQQLRGIFARLLRPAPLADANRAMRRIRIRQLIEIHHQHDDALLDGLCDERRGGFLRRRTLGGENDGVHFLRHHLLNHRGLNMMLRGVLRRPHKIRMPARQRDLLNAFADVQVKVIFRGRRQIRDGQRAGFARHVGERRLRF